MQKLTNGDIPSFSILTLFHIIYSAKKFVAIFMAVTLSIALLIVTNIPDNFKAEVTLMPTTANSNGLGGLASQLGGLSSLSGIDMGADSNKVLQFIELSKSRSFVQGFIEKYEMIPFLLAVQSYNQKTNQIIFNSKIYDDNSKSWILGDDLIKPPTAWQAFSPFMDLVEIFEDKSSGMVKVSFKYIEPSLAKTWLKLYVEELNEYIRSQDLEEANKSMAYLMEKTETNRLYSVNVVLNNLIEDKMKTMLLANVNNGYVLKQIFAITLPEEKDSPNRTLLVIVILLFGFLINIMIILTSYLIEKDKLDAR